MLQTPPGRLEQSQYSAGVEQARRRCIDVRTHVPKGSSECLTDSCRNIVGTMTNRLRLGWALSGRPEIEESSHCQSPYARHYSGSRSQNWSDTGDAPYLGGNQWRGARQKGWVRYEGALAR